MERLCARSLPIIAGLKACAHLLRPGGILILTTPINDNYFQEFYLNDTVYGAKFKAEPAGIERTYFGDYDFQCFDKVLQRKQTGPRFLCLDNAVACETILIFSGLPDQPPRDEDEYRERRHSGYTEA